MIGTPTENFLKRWIAFLIGGCVALVVELLLLPVKARSRMVESITSAIQQIIEMEKCIAVNIDEGVKIDIVAAGQQSRFERATAKANAALGAAETFRGPSYPLLTVDYYADQYHPQSPSVALSRV